MPINPQIGVSLLTGGASVVGGLLGLAGSSVDYHNQKSLMALQNQYNQQNATIAYDRQRELTRDSALLEKEGKLAAGVNTAFGQNGSVSTASSVAPASSVSIPSPTNFSDSMIGATNSIVGALTGLAQAKADVDLKHEQREQLRIDNLTRNIMNLASVNKLTSESGLNFSKTAEQAIKNKFADRVYSAAATESENNADISGSNAMIASANAAVQGAMNEVNYNEALERLELLKKQGKLTNAQYNTEVKKLSLMDTEMRLNRAKTADAYSHVGVNRAQARNLDSLTDLNAVEYYIKDASKEDVIELAHRQVQEHGPQSISEDMWNIFNNWDKASGWQRMRALSEIAPSLATDFWSGASHSAGSAFGSKVGPEQNTYNYHEYTNSKGEHAVYTRKKVKNYKPNKH